MHVETGVPGTWAAQWVEPQFVGRAQRPLGHQGSDAHKGQVLGWGQL